MGDDHDLLIKIDTKLTNFADEMRSVKSRLAWHDKFIYVGIGGIVVIEFLAKLIK